MTTEYHWSKDVYLTGEESRTFKPGKWVRVPDERPHVQKFKWVVNAEDAGKSGKEVVK